MKNKFPKTSQKPLNTGQGEDKKYLFQTEKWLPGIALCTVIDTSDNSELASFVCHYSVLRNTSLLQDFLAELLGCGRVRLCDY